MHATTHPMIRRISRCLPPLLIVALLTGPFAAPTSATGCAEPDLGVGDAAFCEAVDVDHAQVRDPALCGVAGVCPQWRLHVAKDGSALRVALSAVFQDAGYVRPWADFSASAAEAVFRLQILDDTGEVLTEGSTGSTFTAYGVEVFLPEPEAGSYTVRVVPESVVDMAFRLRAKLEAPAADHGSTRRTVLTPNLRAIPPFEFSFFAPTATYGPSVPTPAPQASCMAEEVEEAVDAGRPPPRLCLRYSMGFENSGDGMFWLSVFCPMCQYYYEHIKPVGNAVCGFFGCAMGDVVGEAGISRDWPLTQVRYYSDGTCCKVESLGSAGVGRFHPAHGHLHYQNAYSFELFRVDDEGWGPEDGRPRRLEPVGPGGKLGVFPGDEMLSDWNRFYQAPRGGCPPSTPDRCGPGMGNSPLLGLGEPKLNAGWGDVYEWNRGGNYVDFPADDLGAPLAGFYLLRGTSDPDQVIVETNERDNSGYGFLSVASNGTVQLLERGYGTSPWDRKKNIVTAVPG